MYTFVHIPIILLGLICSVRSVDEIRARVLVQYHPWEQWRYLRVPGGGAPGLRNLRANKILSNVPGSDVVLTDDILKHGAVLLECFANVPILWDYEGFGYPSLTTTGRTGRKFGNFSDPRTYTYWSKVHLVEPSERNTGKYVCRSVAHADMNVDFYIYVPGFNFFVPKSGLRVPVALADSILQIPCAISHPIDLIVDLYKLTVNGHPELLVQGRFEPKGGFFLDIHNDINPWGTYICVASNKTMTNSMVVFAQSPKDLRVHVTVNSSFVPVDPRIRQRFICEALQNITLEFEPPLNLTNEMGTRISYEYNPESGFPFVVELVAEPAEFGNHRLIRCVYTDPVVEPDGPLYPDLVMDRTLHTWEYSSFGNNKSLMFQFNSSLEAFVCCTANSFVAPSEIYFIPCSTHQECHLRSHMNPNVPRIHRQPRGHYNSQAVQHYTDPKSRIDAALLPRGCIGVEQFLEQHEGLFWCRLNSEHTSVSNELRILCSNCDDESPSLRPMGIPLCGDGQIRVQLRIPPGALKVGDEVEVSCEYSRFEYSSQVHWAYRKSDGNLELAEDVKEGQQGTLKTWKLRISAQDITAVVCLVPRWDSASWGQGFALLNVVTSNTFTTDITTTAAAFTEDARAADVTIAVNYMEIEQ